ncbi:MAG: hypothetical protein J7L19_06090 [Dehalococcoidia bacterium]|nr:hypothetical protein [Dehalococcoidia bacterium]
MKRRQYLLLVGLTIIAGLVGGAVSNQVFMARPALAQGKKQYEKVITAEQFLVVDKDGKTRAIVGHPKDVHGIGIWLYDENGMRCGTFSATETPMLSFWTEKGPSAGKLLLTPTLISLDSHKSTLSLAIIGSFARMSVEFGKLSSSIMASPLGAHLDFYDPDGKLRSRLMTADIGLTSTGKASFMPFFAMYDKDGHIIWFAPDSTR